MYYGSLIVSHKWIVFHFIKTLQFETIHIMIEMLSKQMNLNEVFLSLVVSLNGIVSIVKHRFLLRVNKAQTIESYHISLHLNSFGIEDMKCIVITRRWRKKLAVIDKDLRDNQHVEWTNRGDAMYNERENLRVNSIYLHLFSFLFSFLFVCLFREDSSFIFFSLLQCIVCLSPFQSHLSSIIQFF